LSAEKDQFFISNPEMVIKISKVRLEDEIDILVYKK